MANTLADHLRSRSDAELGDLLRLRPDLVVPAPTDIATLAARAQSRVSSARALDDLDEFTLRILDAARLCRELPASAGSAAAADPAGSAATVHPAGSADSADAAVELDAVLAMATAPGSGATAAQVRAAVDRLLARCLLYGSAGRFRVAGGVDEASSPYPAGLGRPAADLDDRVARRCADPAALRRTLLSAPPSARAVLDRLAVGPPLGTVSTAAAVPATGAQAREAPAAAATAALGPGDGVSPVRWLVEAGLLAVVTDAPATAGSQAVELPREVGLLLRRDTGPLGALRPDPPAAGSAERDPKAVDSTGAGQAMELVRQAGALLEALAAEPAPLLRTGGIGVRELRRLARAGGVSESLAGLLIEIGYAAGLLGAAELPATASRTAVDQQILPTGNYDQWMNEPVARRWERLAGAWLAMTRRAGLIGRRDDRDRPITALSTDVERAGAPTVRRTVLGVLAALPPGAAPTADEVLALLAWQAPRRSRGRDDLHREVLDEAAQLGVTGLGVLTGYGRSLLAGEGRDGRDTAADDDPLGVRATEREHRGAASTVERALDDLLPSPVDHVLVQADLTVVVPGPPEPALAAELELVAEPESIGAASVHRVTPASVRRALDAGYQAAELHELFARRSRTPVPQGLTYLIDDSARTHGGLRAGSAGGYLRSDDEALLATVLADRRLAALSLRRLAPTVLVCVVPAGRMLEALRQAGYAPVPEDGTGAALRTGRPRARRAPARHPVTLRSIDPLAAPKLTAPWISGLVEQLRRGEAAARAVRRTPGTIRAATGQAVDGLAAVQAHSQALAVLQQAVRDKALVWVGYVDAHGAAASRLVRPVSIGAGYLRAEDERTETLHTFALQRVTAAVVHD
ncbi:helicase-associated domain-containing protein [Solwaraspora sp. WMMA2059]|uniref:helicase-associated domain-containing protein n=1 Tax=Solwaraspora sp. WMMA2059 TaxID=3015160 RepID=UPI00248B7011|nr:helicase-associated domain-containing protein [Solwaraspora sp. WMMA2059]WBB96494.1 helicase-associated domain-containing protein [Solwaraspora sp. WMMA2059]